MKLRLEAVFDKVGFCLQYFTELREMASFERLNCHHAGDHQPTGDCRECTDSYFPSNRPRHPDQPRSFNLYPNDLTDTMASSRSGSFCLSRRTCTSTVLVV